MYNGKHSVTACSRDSEHKINAKVKSDIHPSACFIAEITQRVLIKFGIAGEEAY
jgi:hypothetical protein